MISRHEQSRIVLANPDEQYNSTDLNSNQIPNAQLIFHGKNKTGIQFIVYDKGGYVIQRKCMIHRKMPGQKYEVFIYSLTHDVDTLVELTESIANLQ
jgi:hypothetical protein